MDERLDQRTIEHISGPAWVSIRPIVEALAAAMLSVSTDARGVLVTNYVKFTSPILTEQPYGVLWLKRSAELVLGLALDPTSPDATAHPPIPGHVYRGLTAYFRITAQSGPPSGIDRLAREAFRNTIANG